MLLLDGRSELPADLGVDLSPRGPARRGVGRQRPYSGRVLAVSGRPSRSSRARPRARSGSSGAASTAVLAERLAAVPSLALRLSTGRRVPLHDIVDGCRRRHQLLKTLPEGLQAYEIEGPGRLQ